MEFAIGILPVYRNQIPPVGLLKKMLMVNGPSWYQKHWAAAMQGTARTIESNVGLQRLAQGHFDMWPVWGGIPSQIAGLFRQVQIWTCNCRILRSTIKSLRINSRKLRISRCKINQFVPETWELLYLPQTLIIWFSFHTAGLSPVDACVCLFHSCSSSQSETRMPQRVSGGGTAPLIQFSNYV